MVESSAQFKMLDATTYGFVVRFTGISPLAKFSFDRAEKFIREKAKAAIPALQNARSFRVVFEKPSLRGGEFVLSGSLRVVAWGDRS